MSGIVVVAEPGRPGDLVGRNYRRDRERFVDRAYQRFAVIFADVGGVRLLDHR